MGLVFHRLIQKDLAGVFRYYEQEVGLELAKQFYDEFEQVIEAVAANPRRFHLVAESLRRANFRRFPYHVLYRESSAGVRILVLRHHRRDPRFGFGRR